MFTIQAVFGILFDIFGSKASTQNYMYLINITERKAYLNFRLFDNEDQSAQWNVKKILKETVEKLQLTVYDWMTEYFSPMYLRGTHSMKCRKHSWSSWFSNAMLRQIRQVMLENKDL